MSNQGFWKLHHRDLAAILRRRDLSLREFRVLLALASLTQGYGKDRDVLTAGRIAAITGDPPRHVYDSLRTLAQKGLVGKESLGSKRVLRWVNWGSLNGKSDLARLHATASSDAPPSEEMPPDPGSHIPPNPGRVIPPSSGRVIPPSSGSHIPPSSGTHQEVNKKHKKGEEGFEGAAVQILKAYAEVKPPSIDGSRGRARKHILKLLGRHPPEDLLRAVENYRLQTLDTEPKYRRGAGNFFGRDEDWKLYADPDWEPPEDPDEPPALSLELLEEIESRVCEENEFGWNSGIPAFEPSVKPRRSASADATADKHDPSTRVRAGERDGRQRPE